MPDVNTSVSSTGTAAVTKMQMKRPRGTLVTDVSIAEALSTIFGIAKSEGDEY